MYTHRLTSKMFKLMVKRKNSGKWIEKLHRKWMNKQMSWLFSTHKERYVFQCTRTHFKQRSRQNLVLISGNSFIFYTPRIPWLYIHILILLLVCNIHGFLFKPSYNTVFWEIIVSKHRDGKNKSARAGGVFRALLHKDAEILSETL